MEEEILYDVNPLPETVRKWAYDDNVLLLDQDEDLILHGVEYVPLLLEFASDRKCPKREYSLQILDYFGKLSLLHRTAEAHDIGSFARKHISAELESVRGWACDFVRVLEILEHPRRLSGSQMEWTAKYLIK